MAASTIAGLFLVGWGGVDTEETPREFFTEWAVRLDDRCVSGSCRPDAGIQVFVSGDRLEGDPGSIELAIRPRSRS